jgi:hypothetical protein
VITWFAKNWLLLPAIAGAILVPKLLVERGFFFSIVPAGLTFGLILEFSTRKTLAGSERARQDFEAFAKPQLFILGMFALMLVIDLLTDGTGDFLRNGASRIFVFMFLLTVNTARYVFPIKQAAKL